MLAGALRMLHAPTLAPRLPSGPHLYRLRSASGAFSFASASLVLFRYSLLRPYVSTAGPSRAQGGGLRCGSWRAAALHTATPEHCERLGWLAQEAHSPGQRPAPARTARALTGIQVALHPRVCA